MNRYRRISVQPQASLNMQQSDLSLLQPGAAIYFQDEPKKPNIISRGKGRSSLGQTTGLNAAHLIPSVPTASSLSQPQHFVRVQPQLNIGAVTQSNQQAFEVSTTMSSVTDSFAASVNQSIQELLGQVSNSAASDVHVTTESTIDDTLPFQLDENTQTLLNNGQFETIETEDGNVLLILKEDIEQQPLSQTTVQECQESLEGNMLDGALTFNTNDILAAVAPVNSATGYIIDNDVTTCTSSIESPISSVGINSSVVERQQEQIEQQHLQQPASLLQMTTETPLDALSLSDQSVLANNVTGDNMPIGSKSYFLLQMSDGQSYLIPADGPDGTPTVLTTDTVTLSQQFFANSSAASAKPRQFAAANTSKSKPKPKTKMPSVKTPKVKVPVVQSQPPPLVPITKRPATLSPIREQHKPYRFIMSEAEEKMDEPVNPYVIKVLGESPEKPKSPMSETSIKTVINNSPPKLISGGSAIPVSRPEPSQMTKSTTTSTPPDQQIVATRKPVSDEADIIAKSTTTSTPPDQQIVATRKPVSDEVAIIAKSTTTSTPSDQQIEATTLKPVSDEEGIINLGNGLYKCSFCPKVMKLRVTMVNHIKRSHKCNNTLSKLGTIPPTTIEKPGSGKVNQVFLCSRCDVIFTTSEELKKHFDVKHPNLIGNKQVILRSKKVPVKYLQSKLQQSRAKSPTTIPIITSDGSKRLLLQVGGQPKNKTIATSPSTGSGSPRKKLHSPSPAQKNQEPFPASQNRPQKNQEPCPASQNRPQKNQEPFPASQNRPQKNQEPFPASQNRPQKKQEPCPASQNRPQKIQEPSPASQNRPLRKQEPSPASQKRPHRNQEPCPASQKRPHRNQEPESKKAKKDAPVSEPSASQRRVSQRQKKNKTTDEFLFY